MFKYIALLFLGFNSMSLSLFSQERDIITMEEASRLAQPALNCMQKEYPNKPANVMGRDEDAVPPHEQHPAFYGCFDWHSAVHGHWTLVKLLKEFPGLPQESEIRKKLNENITADHIKKEIAFFYDKNNTIYERTYGWAWLLKLSEELRTWDDTLGRKLAADLQPLADSIVHKYELFLPKLNYPIRIGEHANTAFGLTFAWDYANTFNMRDFKNLIESRARDYYMNDKNCPLSWEPGGFDFLSPCLIEADLMSRVLNDLEFKTWLDKFLPELTGDAAIPLQPGIVTDRTDGKLVHLDGLNLSRAWCLYHIAAKLHGENENILKVAREHLETALPNVTSGAYEGEHWLATFAVYALFSEE